MLQQAFPKKAAVRIIINLSYEPGARPKLRHGADGISGRASGGLMRLHPAKVFIDFQQFILVNKSHTTLRQLHFR